MAMANAFARLAMEPYTLTVPSPPTLPFSLPYRHSFPSPPQNTSSPPTCFKYDVFLSFSGKDCRGKFCEDLYDALHSYHIKVYMDDRTLRRGSDINKGILGAIEESRFSIVILSKNYAFSRYCLDELFVITQCIDDKLLQHRALPLFLKVSPDDVERQKGDYEKAFELHEKRVRGKQYRKQKRILEWRLALKRIVNLAGWVYPDSNKYRSKTQLIRKIVQELTGYLRDATPAIGVQFAQSNPELKVVSMYELCEEFEDMDIIWICRQEKGMCSNAIARFVYGVVTTTCPGEIKLLPSKALASGISIRSATPWDPLREMDVIRSRLQKKMVLVMVDDIHILNQLTDLASFHSLLGSESRIIISNGDPKKMVLNVHSLSFDGPKSAERNAFDIAFYSEVINEHDMKHSASLLEKIQCAYTRKQVRIHNFNIGMMVILETLLNQTHWQEGMLINQVT